MVFQENCFHGVEVIWKEMQNSHEPYWNIALFT